jgi:hypothetical protein
MVKTIQFVIEMPIPTHLEGVPYDEIEAEFRKNYMNLATKAILEDVKKEVKNIDHLDLQTLYWLISAQQAKLIVAK